MKEVLQIVD